MNTKSFREQSIEAMRKKREQEAAKAAQKTAAPAAVSRPSTVAGTTGVVSPQYRAMLNDAVSQANLYALRGPLNVKTLADTLTGTSMYTPKTGDLNNWNQTATRQGVRDRVQATQALARYGLFDNEDYAYSDAYNHMPQTSYLQSLVPVLQKMLVDSQAKDEAARIKAEDYASKAARLKGISDDYYHMLSYEDLLDAVQGDEEQVSSVVSDWLELYSLTPDAKANAPKTWDELRNIDSDEEYNNWLSELNSTWVNADWNTIGLTDEYRSETERIQSLIDLNNKELDRRNVIEALENSARSDVNFAELSKYTGESLSMGQNDHLMFNSPYFFMNNADVDEDTFNQATNKTRVNYATRDVEAYTSPYLDRGYDFMTSDELAVYNYFYNTDQNRAAEYLNALQSELLSRRASADQSFWETLATNDGTGWMAWLLAGGMDIMNANQSVEQMIASLNGTADPNAEYFDNLNRSGYIYNAQMNELGNVGWANNLRLGEKNILQHGYGAFSALRDTAASMTVDALLGGSGKVNQLLMGAKAMSGGLQESAERGLSAGQSLLNGGVNAFLGYITEKIGIGPDTLQGGGKGILSGFVSEGAEEVLENLGTTAADEVISELFGTQSAFEQEVESLRLQGVEDPEFEALKGKMTELATDFVYGGFAGGVLSAPGVISQASGTRSIGKQVNTEGDAEQVLSIAESMEPITKSFKLAKDIRNKLGKGKKISNYQMGQLTMQLEQDLGTEQATVLNRAQDAAIENRLLELGEDAETAKKNAPVIRKVYRGQNTTAAERAAVKWNDNAKQVTLELAREQKESESGVKGAAPSDSQRVGSSWRTAMDITSAIAVEDTRGKQEQLRNTATKVEKDVETAVNNAEKKISSRNAKGKNMMNKVVAYATEEGEVKGEFQRFEMKDGQVQVVVKSGDTEAAVKVGDLTDEGGAGTAAIIEYTATSHHNMSADEANTMMTTYQQTGGDVKRFIANFEAVYAAGFADVDAPATSLPAEVANAVYEQAKAEGAKAETKRVAKAKRLRATVKGSVSWLGQVEDNSAIRGAGDLGALSGALEGMTEEQRTTVEVMQGLAEELKVNIVLYEGKGANLDKLANGKYEPSTHTLYVDVNSGAGSVEGMKAATEHHTLGYAMMRTLGHELTHHMESTSAEGYAQYKAAVKKQLQKNGQSWAELVRGKIENAAAEGRKLTRMGAEAEVVADASEYMLQESSFTKKLDSDLYAKVKSFVQSFMKKVREIFTHITGEHRESAALRKAIDGVKQYTGNLQELWDAALEEAGTGQAQHAVGDTAGNMTEEAKVQYSFGGRLSETADKSMLHEAMELEFDDVDAETIRKKTGWYRGMDGQWRYEIDDSKATYAAAKITDGVVLGDIFEHQMLYEAYPEIAETPIEVTTDLPENTRAGVKGKTVQLNASYFLDKETGALVWNEKNKDTLLHEVQHLIQKEEGFAGGSNIEYWTDRLNTPGKNDKLIERLNKQIDTLWNAQTEEMQELMRQHNRKLLELKDMGFGGNIETEYKLFQDLDVLKMRADEISPDVIWEYETLKAKLKEAIEGNRKMTPTELYAKTAGEIEARNTAARRILSESQRKGLPPIVDEDAVFADAAWQFSLQDSSGKEITLSSDEVQENKTYVANMKPVVVLTGNPMSKESGVDFYTAGTAYFQSIGGSATNEVLGTVDLNEKGIRHLINRKLTWRKTALLRAVKPVIEQGKILHVENDHNNKDTAVIGAVVQLDGQNYYMGVVVSQNDQRNNQYELHDAVIVQIEKKSADALTKTPSADRNQTRRGIGNSSIAIILSDLANYNTQFAKGEQFSTPDIRYSTRDLPDTPSIREYLGTMKPTSRMTETEKDLLGRYQKKLSELQEKERLAAEQDEIIKTAPAASQELLKAKNRYQVYRQQANRIARELARMERAEGFAGIMATSQTIVNEYLSGATGSVADAQDALETEIKGLTDRLKVIGNTVEGTAQGQRNAFARGLFNQTELNRAAKQLKDSYNSRMSVKVIADRLALAYGEIYANEGAEGAKRFAAAAKELAQDILDSSRYRYRSEMLATIAEEVPVISLTETDLQEIKNAGLTVAEYKRALSPYVRVAEGASDLSSYVTNAISYGGQIGQILGDETEGNLAMALYNVIQAERASEATATLEGMSESESLGAVLADVVSANLPLTADSSTITYLRKELNKYADESAETAQRIEQAIMHAEKATRRASSVWRAAVKERNTSKAAVEYYRKLEEQRRITELREQKQAITDQLKGEYGKKLVEKVQKQREEYREREQKAREYRRTRDEVEKLRRGIGRKVKRLNALRIRETDQKHVPHELQHVADLVMQTFTDSSLSKLAFAPEQTASLARRYRKLQELESDMTYYWDDEIEENIDNLQELGEAYTALREREGGVPSTMSLEGVELETEILQGVDAIVSNVLRMIDATNDAFLKGRTETFDAFATKTGEDLIHHDDAKILKGKLGDVQMAVDEWLRTGNMTPIYFFERLQNGRIMEVFDQIRRAQTEYARIIRECQDFVQSAKEKYHYGSWAGDAKLNMQTSQKHQITLSREQAMWVYATSKREKSNKLYPTEHLRVGGFQYKNTANTGEGNYRATDKPHSLGEADIAKIGEWLTAEQKAYADEVVGFLSTTMADYGNDASMDMFGYKKFLESYYFPFQTAAAQGFQRGDEGASGDNAGTGRVKNSSFTKKVQHGAKVTLIMDDFTTVAVDHMQKMATYAAMVQPIENMKRLMNHKVIEEDGTINTIRALIGQKYGTPAQKYLQDFLKDLNGAAQGDNRATKGVYFFISAFKRGAVMASASVVLQQPTAIARAMAMVNPKYFMTNPFYRPSKGVWDKMMKYSGTAVIKDMGKFDVGLGLTASEYISDEHLKPAEAYRRFKEESRLKGGVEFYKRFMDWLTAAPGKADQWTWGLIWQAVEKEAAEENPGMDTSSEAFLELVGQRFDDVIDHTQVYDSVLTRSNLMRSKDVLHKMATSFMSEPTLSINMLYNALTGEHSGKKRAVIIGSVMVSQVLAGAMAALVQAWNDDDDERNWAEKYADRAVGNIVDNLNPLSMIPYISDLMSLFEGYSVERPDMSVVNDILTYGKNYVKAFENGGAPDWKQTENFIGSLANMVGLPAKNISREMRRTWNAITNTDWSAPNMTNVGYAMKEYLPFYSTKNTAYYERIVAAELRGDTKKAEDYREYMLTSKMVTEDKLTSGLKNAMKEQYIAGKADEKTAIKYLVQIGAYDNEDDAYWEVDKWEYMQETGNSADTYRKYTDYFSAIETGSNLKAVTQEYLDNGVEKKTLAEQITSQYKQRMNDLWKAGKKTEYANLQVRLLTAYQVLGYDRDEKLKDIEKWRKEVE